MRYSDLYIEIDAKVIKIGSMEITEEINQHGVAKINIVTIDETEYSLMRNITVKKDIKIVLKKDENINIIFAGVPTCFRLEKFKDIHKIELDLKSKSFMLDLKKKRRSFQDENNPYSKLFNEVIEGEEASIFLEYTEEQIQNESIIQYDETNWEFLKRLASKISEVVLTDVKNEQATIRIGKQRGNDYKVNTHDFHVVNENAEYIKALNNYGDTWSMHDKKYYIIESVEDYLICDNILYEEIQFKVSKKITKLDKGIIRYTYWLLKSTAFKQNLIVNEKIQGASINGKVMAIEGDRVKVHLSIDDKAPELSKAFWYKYETPYTSEGSTGFYSMPQKGDSVKLYIPKSEIDDGYVRTVNRTDGEVSIKTEEPDIKYYGNIYNKELMLAPNEFQVTAKNGLVLINMDDKEGIEITSYDDINIITNSQAKITANKIALRAEESILIRTTQSGILIGETINIKAKGGVSGV